MPIHQRSCHLLSVVALFLLAAVCPAPGRAQSTASQLPAEPRMNLSDVLDKLVEKNAERAEALEKYQGRRTYQMVYTGFPKSFQAEMVVDMTYDAPATKQFKIVSQSGSQWIIDRIFKRLLESEQEALTEENRERLALNSRNYDFDDFHIQNVSDNCSYVVAVEPRVPSKLLYRGRLWVDNKDFAVCRIEAEPAKNPSFMIKKTEIHHSYVKIGEFWLPSENESVSYVRGGGRAVLTIKYQSYEILASHSLQGRDLASSSNSAAPSHPGN
jgi:outer membrane lipoprotein-sorting protein